jgi:hypothetical protein
MTILISLIAALIMPNILMILNSSQLDSIFQLVKDFLISIFKGTVTEGYGERFKDAFANFYEFVKLKSGRIILSGLFFLIIYIIGSFLNGISNYAMGGMVNDHMSSLSHLGFIQALIRDLKSACIFQITYVGINLIYDTLLIIICYNILFGMFSVFGIVSIFLASTVFVGLYALKLTYLSGIMPAMIADKKGLLPAIKSSFKINKKQGSRLFSTYVASVLLIIYINVSMAVVTLFSSLLITVPLSFLLIICIQFVTYYTINDKKYFINYDNIIIPKKLREEEKLLDDIDI